MTDHTEASLLAASIRRITEELTRTADEFAALRECDSLTEIGGV